MKVKSEVKDVIFVTSLVQLQMVKISNKFRSALRLGLLRVPDIHEAPKQSSFMFCLIFLSICDVSKIHKSE